MTRYLRPPRPPIQPNSPLHLGKGKQVVKTASRGTYMFNCALHARSGAVMFVNNGQLGRKYLSPERLRTAGIVLPHFRPRPVHLRMVL